MKYFSKKLLGISMACFFLLTLSVNPANVQAATSLQLNASQIINLLISLNLIPADKIEAIRTVLQYIDSNQNSTSTASVINTATTTRTNSSSPNSIINSVNTSSSYYTSSVKVNAVCGLKADTCQKGNLINVSDSSSHYKWTCIGTGGGDSVPCANAKPYVGQCYSNEIPEWPACCDLINDPDKKSLWKRSTGGWTKYNEICDYGPKAYNLTENDSIRPPQQY